MPTYKFSARKSNTFALLAALVFGAALHGCRSNQAPAPVASPNTARAIVPGTGVTIFAAGDIADCASIKPEDSGAAKTAKIVAAALADDKDATVLTLGDLAYPTGLLAEFTNCYEPTWGRFKERTHPAPGNHEYYSPMAAGYYDYFGAGAGPDRRGYYSLDIGTWHVVSINSNLQPQEHQQQLAWLKADLAQHPARCTLAYWHHPLYSSGGHGNNDKMKDVWLALEAAKVDVVLNGHDHDYERFAPQDAEGRRDDAQGIREFVVGTGGAERSPFAMIKQNSEARDNSTFGVLRMSLKDGGYEWEFFPTKPRGFFDKGATFCH